MKLVAVTSLFLLGTSQAAMVYWCSNENDCSGPGNYPTYVCGQKVGWGYYSTQSKKWIQGSESKPSSKYTKKPGGFAECCHQGGRAACNARTGL